MTVRELIEKLQEQDPDEVVLAAWEIYDEWHVRSVGKTELRGKGGDHPRMAVVLRNK